jgi:hypothetical protein
VKRRVGHIEFNVQPHTLQFYRDLLTALSWHTIAEDVPPDGAPVLGMAETSGASLWPQLECSVRHRAVLMVTRGRGCVQEPSGTRWWTGCTLAMTSCWNRRDSARR